LRASSTNTAAMPSAITPPQESAPFYVPTVDIAPFLADPSSMEADKIIASVRAACISTGFFQITGHGISRQLQKDVFKAAAAFFKLPFDEKKKLDAKTTIGHRGYDVLASQSYEADVLPDLKEVPIPESEISSSLPNISTPNILPGLLYRHFPPPNLPTRTGPPLLHGSQRLASYLPPKPLPVSAPSCLLRPYASCTIRLRLQLARKGSWAQVRILILGLSRYSFKTSTQGWRSLIRIRIPSCR